MPDKSTIAVSKSIVQFLKLSAVVLVFTLPIPFRCKYIEIAIYSRTFLYELLDMYMCQYSISLNLDQVLI